MSRAKASKRAAPPRRNSGSRGEGALAAPKRRVDILELTTTYTGGAFRVPPCSSLVAATTPAGQAIIMRTLGCALDLVPALQDPNGLRAYLFVGGCLAWGEDLLKDRGLRVWGAGAVVPDLGWTPLFRTREANLRTAPSPNEGKV